MHVLHVLDVEIEDSFDAMVNFLDSLDGLNETPSFHAIGDSKIRLVLTYHQLEIVCNALEQAGCRRAEMKKNA